RHALGRRSGPRRCPERPGGGGRRSCGCRGQVAGHSRSGRCRACYRNPCSPRALCKRDPSRAADIRVGLLRFDLAGGRSMIDLLAADLRRIMWRMMTHVIAIVSVVVIAAVGAVDFHHTTKHPFDLRTGLPNSIATFTGPVVLAAFIFGASLLGADYTSRSLTTLLTWESRRARLLLSRAVTCAAFT